MIKVYELSLKKTVAQGFPGWNVSCSPFINMLQLNHLTQFLVEN